MRSIKKILRMCFELSLCFGLSCTVWLGFFFEKHLTKQLYKISVLGGMVTWKIVSVLAKFWLSSPWKSFIVKYSEKYFWSVISPGNISFAFPGKFDVFVIKNLYQKNITSWLIVKKKKNRYFIKIGWLLLTFRTVVT